MQGHFYKPHCKCPGKQTKKCGCGAKWAYIISVGIDPRTGKRKQKKKGGFDTKGEAETAAAILLSSIKQGTYIEESNDSFKEFAFKWLDLYSSTGKIKDSTINLRRREINRILPYFEFAKLKDIKRDDYQDALMDLHKKGYSHSALTGAHSTSKMIFRKAIEQGKIKNDPTQYAQVPKTRKTVEELEREETLEKYLEKEDLALFLKTAKERGLDRDYIIFKLLAYTGMRIGELCGLKWKDIDFENHTISINRTYYNFTGNAHEYVLQTPKTSTSKRTIDVDEELIRDLERHRLTQNKFKMRHRNKYFRSESPDDEFVIAKTTKNYPGWPEYTALIVKRMTRLLSLAELNENLTPHSLRHTHVSLLAEAGVELYEIMDRLGHKDELTTKTVYTHVTKTRRKEAVEKFGNLMKNL